MQILPYPDEVTPVATRTEVQAAMMKNREIVDRASDGFVSYLRYYKEH